MKRWLPALLALPCIAATPAARDGGAADPSVATAGEATVHATGRNAFSFPAANLSDEERTRFVIGNSFFRRNWVQAPSSTQARDGLGPHFIARSCGGCHAQDGRGAPPDLRKRLADDDTPVALLMRLSIPGVNDHGGPNPEPTYGDQFNNAAVQGVKPEGRVVVHTRGVPGRFSDGMRYELRQPRYSFADLGYGPMRPGTMVSPRIAPQMIGIGLLESIPDSEVLRNAAEQARAPGPIKGRPNRVWDAYAEREMLGRFGWKANVATVAHQTAGAFVGDIGITSSRFPGESCTQSQTDCLNAPRGGQPERPGAHDGANGASAATAGAPRVEIDDTTLADVIFYSATLAPPARRNADDPQVRRGEKLFHAAQCAVCHRPSYLTGDAALAERFPRLTSPALKGQTIWPYTDLLLHDMGPGLADGRPDFAADGRQWRTPPLWGIGLIKDVNDHNRLLHDGRARGVLEAVLWHGGEAQASRNRVLRLTRDERAALVKFVESL